MSTDAPRSPGALETAVALFDDLYQFVLKRQKAARHPLFSTAEQHVLAQIESRRAALQPRLDRRRENQAKPRGGKP